MLYDRNQKHLKSAHHDSLQKKSNAMTGVYWGAFDPLTEAHSAIIATALREIPLKKLIIIVNNQSYKTYVYPIELRLEMLNELIKTKDLKNIELRWQDDAHKLDYFALKQIATGRLCAVSGYDAYQTWMAYSTPSDRALYDAIAVIPRGDDTPILYDPAAFVLPIDSKYRHVSSTNTRANLYCKIQK